MAQLNDLIVNGYSRFLNSAYGNLNGSATSALCAAYAASTNTAIKVNSATSATCAYDVINKAIKVNSATSATCAYDVINKAINVNSAGSAAKAASATSALSAGSAAKAAELTNKAIKVNSAGSADYATIAGSAPVAGHNHGIQVSSFAKILSNNSSVSTWSGQFGVVNNGYWLFSIRAQANAPSWFRNNYAAGIAFGGEDTKGVLSVAYNTPAIKIAGGNGGAPVWWIGLNGTNGKSYTLPGADSTLVASTGSYSGTNGLTALSARGAYSATNASTASNATNASTANVAKTMNLTGEWTSDSNRYIWFGENGTAASAGWDSTLRFNPSSNTLSSTNISSTSITGVTISGTNIIGDKGKFLSAEAPTAVFNNTTSINLSGTNITATTFSGNLSGSAASALTSKSALSAGSASKAAELTNKAIKVNSAGSASTAAYASTYPVDYDSCVVTYGDTGCFTKIKNAYTANKKIYMLATVQSYPGNAGNSICKIPLTYSLVTGTTYNCFTFNFVNDGGISYWGSTAAQQGVVYSYTCSSDAAAGWHTQGVNPYASTLASTAGTAYYLNVNSSDTNTWFNVPLYSAANNQFYYDSNYMLRYNPNVDALSADNILTKAVASNQGAISWQAWKTCMLIYGSNTAHTIDLSNLSEDVVYWLFVGGPKTINLTHTANNISLHCYDTTVVLNKSNQSTSAFSIRDNASFTTGAGTARYHGTFSVPIVKASSGDIFVMMSYGDCH